MQPIFDMMSSITKRLFEPADALQDPEQRRQARLLASMLVAFIILLVWMIAARVSDVLTAPGTPLTQLIIALLAEFALFALYWGSRTVHYKTSAIITVLLIFFVIHIAPFLEGGAPYNFLFGLAPILLAGIFFGMQWVLLLAIGNVGIMLLYFPLTHTAIESYSWYFRLMLIVETILLIFMHYRNTVERDRRATLQGALEEAQQLNAIVQASEAQLRVVVDASPDMIFNIDPEGLIQYFNRDEDTHSVVGQSIADVITPGANALIMQAMQQATTEQNAVTYETSTAEGTIYSIRVGAIQSGDEASGFVLAMTDITAQKQAEDQAKREQQQEELIQAQRQLLKELSTPVIPVMEDILALPLIGEINPQRAQDIMRALLQGLNEHRARVVILDVTGVPVIDTKVASYLNKTIQAAQLKGASVIVTGISDTVAETLVDLGIDWSAVETRSDLRTGLTVALNRMGVKLMRVEDSIGLT
jgi:PAS domain S-box-containing protein